MLSLDLRGVASRTLLVSNSMREIARRVRRRACAPLNFPLPILDNVK